MMDISAIPSLKLIMREGIYITYDGQAHLHVLPQRRQTPGILPGSLPPSRKRASGKAILLNTAFCLLVRPDCGPAGEKATTYGME